MICLIWPSIQGENYSSGTQSRANRPWPRVTEGLWSHKDSLLLPFFFFFLKREFPFCCLINWDRSSRIQAARVHIRGSSPLVECLRLQPGSWARSENTPLIHQRKTLGWLVRQWGQKQKDEFRILNNEEVIEKSWDITYSPFPYFAFLHRTSSSLCANITYLMVLCIAFLSLIDVKFCTGWDFCLFCSLMDPQFLEQNLAHKRYIAPAYWMNKIIFIGSWAESPNLWRWIRIWGLRRGICPEKYALTEAEAPKMSRCQYRSEKPMWGLSEEKKCDSGSWAENLRLEKLTSGIEKGDSAVFPSTWVQVLLHEP